MADLVRRFDDDTSSDTDSGISTGPFLIAPGTTHFPFTNFTPGEAHNHQPLGVWDQIRRDAALLSLSTYQIATAETPLIAIEQYVADFGLAMRSRAQRHLEHYLYGRGEDLFVDFFESLVMRDDSFALVIAEALRQSDRGSVTIWQHNYAGSAFGQDALFAIGAIDRLDYEARRDVGLVHVWFQDRYEWHPVGYGYESLPGDVRRSSNLIHAAAVECKLPDFGAADYWMMGDCVVPLSRFEGLLSESLDRGVENSY